MKKPPVVMECSTPTEKGFNAEQKETDDNDLGAISTEDLESLHGGFSECGLLLADLDKLVLSLETQITNRKPLTELFINGSVIHSICDAVQKQKALDEGERNYYLKWDLIKAKILTVHFVGEGEGTGDNDLINRVGKLEVLGTEKKRFTSLKLYTNGLHVLQMIAKAAAKASSSTKDDKNIENIATVASSMFEKALKTFIQQRGVWFKSVPNDERSSDLNGASRHTTISELYEHILTKNQQEDATRKFIFMEQFETDLVPAFYNTMLEGICYGINPSFDTFDHKTQEHHHGKFWNIFNHLFRQWDPSIPNYLKPLAKGVIGVVSVGLFIAEWIAKKIFKRNSRKFDDGMISVLEITTILEETTQNLQTNASDVHKWLVRVEITGIAGESYYNNDPNQK